MKLTRRVIAKLCDQVEQAKRREDELDEKLKATPRERAASRGSLGVSLRWDELDALLRAVERRTK